MLNVRCTRFLLAALCMVFVAGGRRLALVANLPSLRLGPRAQLLLDGVHQRAVIIELAHVADLR